MSIKRVKPKLTKRHYTVSVTKYLDWHLRNLWYGGWETIKETPIKARIERKQGHN